MTILLNHPDVDSLAQELSRYTGESTTQSTITALREMLAREQAKRQQPGLVKKNLIRIGRECAGLPVLDARSAEDILDYDAVGAPG